MVDDHVVTVTYDASCARVDVGGRTLEVDRRDDTGRARTCPLELVSAALGS